MKLHERLERVEIEKIMLDIMTRFMEEQEVTRMNKPIKVGNHSISIQCSASHYCLPRITTKLDVYTHMELAILSNGEFVDTSNYQGYKRLEELENYSDGTVYPYVPVELLEDFINYIIKED